MVQCNHKSPLKWKVKESEVIQLCLTLCDSMACSLVGSSVHGILQERILEWFAIAFSRGSSQPRDRTWVSHIAGRQFTLMAPKMAESQGLQADSRARKGMKTFSSGVQHLFWPQFSSVQSLSHVRLFATP